MWFACIHSLHGSLLLLLNLFPSCECVCVCARAFRECLSCLIVTLFISLWNNHYNSIHGLTTVLSMDVVAGFYFLLSYPSLLLLVRVFVCLLLFLLLLLLLLFSIVRIKWFANAYLCIICFRIRLVKSRAHLNLFSFVGASTNSSVQN